MMKLTKEAVVKLSDHTAVTHLLSGLSIFGACAKSMLRPPKNQTWQT